MDAKELRIIIEGVARDLPLALLENKGFEQTMYSIGKIASYLESEQKKRLELVATMKEHQQTVNRFDKMMYGDKDDIEEHPGFAHTLMEMKKQNDKQNKLSWSVLGAVLVAVALQLLKLK